MCTCVKMNVKKSKSCPPTCRDLSIISLLCLCCLIPGGRCFLEENNKSVVAREIAPFHQLAPEEIPPWEETGDEDKVVNVTVLLPFNHTYQPSLKRVGPAILLGFETVRRLQLLPQYRIALTYHDSQCSNVFAPMRATRATMNEGNVHVFFGPSCELALAPVARALKFWNLPLLTAGALTGDYSENKTINGTEFFLTTRTGYGFREIGNFILTHFKKFNWRKVMLMYEKDGLEEVSGLHTCKFFMSTFVEFLKEEKMSYGSFDLESNNINDTIKDNLAQELGLKYSDCSTFLFNARNVANQQEKPNAIYL